MSVTRKASLIGTLKLDFKGHLGGLLAEPGQLVPKKGPGVTMPADWNLTVWPGRAHFRAPYEIPQHLTPHTNRPHPEF